MVERWGAQLAARKDHVMSENEEKAKPEGRAKGSGKRRYLPADKKYQIFLDAEQGGQHRRIHGNVLPAVHRCSGAVGAPRGLRSTRRVNGVASGGTRGQEARSAWRGGCVRSRRDQARRATGRFIMPIYSGLALEMIASAREVWAGELCVYQKCRNSGHPLVRR